MFSKILKRRIIPVIVIDDLDHAVPLAQALLEGGIDIIEITFRTHVAIEAIAKIRKAFPEIILGAGTIITTTQAQQAFNSGIDFGVAPGLNRDIVNFFQGTDLIFIPGVMTPSEIELGLSLGCKLQKFFPANIVGGPKTLKTLAGPYSSHDIKFCPTGGINLENMNEYLSLPIVASVGGSWIATRDQIKNKSWRIITEQAKKAVLRCSLN